MADAAPLTRRYDELLKADVKDAFHHLLLRATEKPYLDFAVTGGFYINVSINGSLLVEPSDSSQRL